MRDQTRITQDRVEGKQRRSSKSNSPVGSARSSLLCVEGVPVQEVVGASACPPLLPELSPSNDTEVAVCSFFNSFVLPPRHPDTIRGYIECLLPLYNASRDGSLLHQTVAAVSLSVGGGHPQSRGRTLARQIFVNALQLTHQAIEDPEESVKDETLMSVLLLGLYEVRPARPKAAIPNDPRLWKATAPQCH